MSILDQTASRQRRQMQQMQLRLSFDNQKPCRHCLQSTACRESLLTGRGNICRGAGREPPRLEEREPSHASSVASTRALAPLAAGETPPRANHICIHTKGSCHDVSENRQRCRFLRTEHASIHQDRSPNLDVSILRGPNSTPGSSFDEAVFNAWEGQATRAASGSVR